MDNVGLSLDAVQAAPSWGKIVNFTAPKNSIGIQMIPLAGTNGTVTVYGSQDGVTFSNLPGLNAVSCSGFGIPTLLMGFGPPVIAARAHLDAIGTSVGTAAMTVWITGY